MKTLTVNRPKRVSLIEQTRIMNESQISTVCTILGWTDQQYCDYQFEQYEQFLLIMFKDSDVAFANKVKYSPLFRGLWNNEWIQRNEEFLKIAKYVVFTGYEVDDTGELIKVPPPDAGSVEKLDRDYRVLHNAKRLIVDHSFIVRFEHLLPLIFKKG